MSLFYKIAKFFGTLCADTYIHKFPFFIIYKPQFHKVKGYQIADIHNKIEDGDILVRRHDGYLSTHFIPGFWSHVGIYVGFDEVVHIIQTGVKKEHLFDFCRTDHIALLRVKDTNPKKAVKYALAYYLQSEAGRLAYDFLFKSDNKNLYCSELVNNCYANIFKDDFWMDNYLRPDDIFNSDKVEKIVVYKNI